MTTAQSGPEDASASTSAETARELRRAKRMEMRRAEILRVAEELFAAHGYDGTSLEKIASGAGYSVGGIYNFFPSKDAVYTAVLNSHSSALAKRLAACADAPGSGLDQVALMAETAIRHLHEYPDHAKFSANSLISRRTPSASVNPTRDMLEAYSLAIRAGQADGTVRAGDPLSLARYVGGLVFAHMHVDPKIAGHSAGIDLEGFLAVVRGALGAEAGTSAT